VLSRAATEFRHRGGRSRDSNAVHPVTFAEVEGGRAMVDSDRHRILIVDCRKRGSWDRRPRSCAVLPPARLRRRSPTGTTWWLPLTLITNDKLYNLQYLMYKVELDIQYLKTARQSMGAWH